MNIYSAMSYLSQSVPCYRESWQKGAILLVKEPHKFFVWLIDGKRTASPCHLQPDDLAADDWQVWQGKVIDTKV